MWICCSNDLRFCISNWCRHLCWCRHRQQSRFPPERFSRAGLACTTKSCEPFHFYSSPLLLQKACSRLSRDNFGASKYFERHIQSPPSQYCHTAGMMPITGVQKQLTHCWREQAHEKRVSADSETDLEADLDALSPRIGSAYKAYAQLDSGNTMPHWTCERHQYHSRDWQALCMDSTQVCRSSIKDWIITVREISAVQTSSLTGLQDLQCKFWFPVLVASVRTRLYQNMINRLQQIFCPEISDFCALLQLTSSHKRPCQRIARPWMAALLLASKLLIPSSRWSVSSPIV